MGYYNKNPYYNPQNFGLVPIGELDDPEADYSFDTLVVWNHPESNTIYWASDCGCSCPSPFEDHNSLADLTAVPYDDEAALDELYDVIRDHCNYASDDETTYRYSRTGGVDRIAAERVDLLQSIWDIVGTPRYKG